MPTFTWKPSTAPKTVDTKIRSSAFGDGYEQRVPDGINSISKKWSLSFVGPIAYIDAIDAFLEARGGHESFDWTDPRGNVVRVVCQSWSSDPSLGLTAASLTAVFRKVPE